MVDADCTQCETRPNQPALNINLLSLVYMAAFFRNKSGTIPESFGSNGFSDWMFFFCLRFACVHLIVSILAIWQMHHMQRHTQRNVEHEKLLCAADSETKNYL